MVKINWTQLAISDLKGVYEYIAKDSSRYAQITVVRFIATSNLSKNNPIQGGWCQNSRINP